mmetsp:Transcript_51692/g.78503  ORF Transcript_51692/g.78503 Transcript_51692/m.78503 type:complete len:270 (-) Transcript_51692:325-1134(-)
MVERDSINIITTILGRKCSKSFQTRSTDSFHLEPVDHTGQASSRFLFRDTIRHCRLNSRFHEREEFRPRFYHLSQDVISLFSNVPILGVFLDDHTDLFDAMFRRKNHLIFRIFRQQGHDFASKGLNLAMPWIERHGDQQCANPTLGGDPLLIIVVQGKVTNRATSEFLNANVFSVPAHGRENRADASGDRNGRLIFGAITQVLEDFRAVLGYFGMFGVGRHDSDNDLYATGQDNQFLIVWGAGGRDARQSSQSEMIDVQMSLLIFFNLV